MNALELKALPDLVGLALAVIMWAVAAGTPFFYLPLYGLSTVAFVLAAVGYLIVLAGIVSFARARTSADPTHPSSASTLVVVGVYRFTRNPMYLGIQIILLAWGLFLSNILALILAPAFALYINRFQITPEERILSAKFGADYAAYRARVRRWL